MRTLLLFAMAIAVCAAQNRDFSRLVVPPAQMPPGTPTGTGSIEGNVVNELTGEPIKKAQVTLGGMGNLTAVTDASGHFAFRQLAAGSFIVQGQASNFSGSRAWPGSPAQRQIALTADQKKDGVTIALTPNASVAGHVVDEEGSPMANCNASALAYDYNQGIKRLTPRGGANTDDRGEYRISNLMPGKYYVSVRCYRNIPLPHPFIRRGSGIEVPSQTYGFRLYPGSADLTGAARVAVGPGATVGGVDFQMNPVAGVTVRGRVTAADPTALPRNIQLALAPRDPVARQFLQAGTAVRRPSNDFVFQHVAPGSYVIEANAFVDETHSYYARLPINVGAEPVEPVEIQLAPVLPIKGTITLEGEAKIPLEGLRVTMNPLDLQQMRQQPNAMVQKDGSFILNNATPGRWRLLVGGASGYIKSISLNEQPASPYALDIPAGAATIAITFSTAAIDMEGALAASPPQGAQVSGMLWPAEEERRQSGLERSFQLDAQGRFHQSGAAPGRYYACAVEATDPWRLLQNPSLLNAMQSRCQAIELVEGRAATVQLPLMTNQELERITEDLDK
ncbi:MAG: carboxypeptidase-like regulatory domain-containing protein [Acidobacteriota bacterium]|nr:carboxypeptidase-like regulatory domain-containing protein [Acidobacteriota bacterium]